MTAPLNRERLVKVLALAESDNDAEALGAIRRAATMARAAGLSLGQAVEGNRPDCGRMDDDSVRVALMESQLSLCRDRIARLERQLAEAGTDAGAYQRGLADGQKAAAVTARLEGDERVRDLERELEAFRAGMDWPALADRYHSRHRRGACAEYAKGLLYRASVGRLTADDQAELRRFATAEARPKRRKAA